MAISIKIPMMLPARFFFSSADSGAIMRQGLFHAPIIAKNTGLPDHAAASTRSGRLVPGHTPVQAARLSAAPSEVHSGCAGCSLETSTSAALKRGLQFGVAAATAEVVVALSFCGGIACR